MSVAHPVRHDVSLLTDQDLYLFNEGTHNRLYRCLGAHPVVRGDVRGTCFAVWAPNAESVSVIGDFNGWSREETPLRPRGGSGIWEGLVEGVGAGAVYKYHVVSRYGGYRVDKADPFAFQAERPPRTGSVVAELEHRWADSAWMTDRSTHNRLDAPMSVYELHLRSWRHVPEDGNRPLTYRELADTLPDYLLGMGFTHVEFMPVMEHPYTPSWGYQTTGYFAPTARFGPAEDFMVLVDALHQAGIGVILDWVPSHFPEDQHGLAFFDGTELYEHADPRKGFHPDWTSLIFNYGRSEVRSFLLSSAMYWLDVHHADGLRVDAVASMLYLDYSRNEGEWLPNVFGGRENLEAISLLQRLNEDTFGAFPDIQTIAEESTAFPGVSRPTYTGGLGFGLKWDMGWMHDTLAYMARDPIHRRHHQGELTFRAIYAFTENFMLPLSHDEVVHGKGSLLTKMPGDDWQQFANLRALLCYQWAQPGKKLLFMGCELAQRQEWSHERSLDWHLLDAPAHAGVSRLVADLNRMLRDQPALHELDVDPAGFEWVDASDDAASVISFLRRGRAADEVVLAVFNLTPLPRAGYRIGVPAGGLWTELLCSDASGYGGSGVVNGLVQADAEPQHGRSHSLALTLPPLGATFLKRVVRATDAA